MLIGIELLDTIRQDETSDEKTLAKKCGYATVTKSGAEKILLTPFSRNILSKVSQLVKTQLFAPLCFYRGGRDAVYKKSTLP